MGQKNRGLVNTPSKVGLKKNMSLKIRKRYKISIKTFITGILIILCLLGCNSIYSASLSHDYKLPELTVAITILLTIISLKRIPIRTIKRWLQFMGVYLIANVAIMIAIVPSDRVTFYAYRFIIFVPLLTLVLMGDAKKKRLFEIAFQYENIVIFYATITLFIWALVSFSSLLQPTGSMTVSWGGIINYPTYFGIFATRQVQPFLGITWIRNQGWYTEGPMFNLIILIALCVEVFLSPFESQNRNGCINGMNIKKVVILVLADISTFTITGMIVMIALFFFKYCLIKNKNNLRNFIKWMGAIIIAILGLFVAYNLFLVKFDTGSWEVRFDDYLAGFAAWKDHLIIGNGFGHMDAIENHMSFIRSYNKGFSSGLFVILAQGGLLFATVYLAAFAGYVRFSIKSGVRELFAMLLIMIILLVTTVFHYTFVMMLLLSYGFAFLMLKEC